MSKRKKQKNLRKRLAQMDAQEIQKEIQTKTNIPGKWVNLDLECMECKKSDHVYMLDDNKTCYCLACDIEFDVFDALDVPGSEQDMVRVARVDDPFYAADTMSEEDLKKLNDAAEKFTKEVNTNTKQQWLPGYKHRYSDDWDNHNQGYGPNRQYQYYKHCTHAPQHVIKGEGGWGVWVGRKEDCLPYLGNYDIVLNLTWTSIKDRHIIPVEELQHWENYGNQFKEIQLDWPDYGVTNLPKDFWLELVDYVKTNKQRVLICCMGGHGRTGTALAIFLVLAMNYAPQEAINWIRLNYCEEAIETVGQESYIKLMAEKKGKADSAETRK